MDLQKTFERFPDIFNPHLIEYINNELASPARFWHGLFHHNMMLKTNELLFDNDETLALATVFHDLVYNPLSFDNEAESARIATMCLWTMPYNDDVISLIHCSRTHQYKNDLEKKFCYLDLEIFSRPINLYKIYAFGIRNEYNFLSNEEYRRGRKEVLLNLKNQINDLFGTTINIDWEISELQNGMFDV